MTTVREPAVAGMFYPDNPNELQQMVQAFLNQAETKGPMPKAIIVPHAGYIYSGPVAASVYALLSQARDRIRRVVLLGPSHRVGFSGLAVSDADLFRTPLGDIPVDREAVIAISDMPQVHRLNEAHALEHSLEVQLPFLQEVLGDFSLVPLVVGDADAEEVGQVLEALWGDDETLIVISSDLSHYHDKATARRMDRDTAKAIEALDPKEVHHEDACGRNPINGLLRVAAARGLHAHTLDLRNSGDTAGPADRVVGYGAWSFH